MEYTMIRSLPLLDSLLLNHVENGQLNLMKRGEELYFNSMLDGGETLH